MKTHSTALLSALFISLFMIFSPLTQADEPAKPTQEQTKPTTPEPSYSERVGEKALRGFTNLNTAFLEVPKSIISVTNQSNLVYGMTGGAAKGMVNMMGRLLSGMVDLITAPVLTKPIVKPDPIWEDFDAETSYDKVFRLDNGAYNANSGTLDNANAVKDE